MLLLMNAPGGALEDRNKVAVWFCLYTVCDSVRGKTYWEQIHVKVLKHYGFRVAKVSSKIVMAIKSHDMPRGKSPIPPLVAEQSWSAGWKNVTELYALSNIICLDKFPLTKNRRSCCNIVLSVDMTNMSVDDWDIFSANNLTKRSTIKF